MKAIKIILRPGHLEDLQAMQALFAASIRNVCAEDYRPEQLDAWASSTENQERWYAIFTKQQIVVAECDGRLCGFATLAEGGYLDLLYVHKDHQRQGIAQKLLDDLIQKAKSAGQRHLTTASSITARRFFEKNGFIIEKEQWVQIKGQHLKNYKMSKSLAY